ncbi:hypothetical protein MMC25_001891 [Agyrium rufum]|nr:hypothetical protein [Agyrium rufum]
MPPFIPRKRRLSTPPAESPPIKKAKPSLFDTLDAHDRHRPKRDTKALLDHLEGSSSDLSLSDVTSSEEEFEDAFQTQQNGRNSKKSNGVTHHEEEEDIDWEDAMQAEASAETPGTSRRFSPSSPGGDLELTLDKGQTGMSFSVARDKKKGPSKIERQIRISTHCMHVQSLMFHNLMRNAWICDKEVQQTLVKQLPAQMKREVETWKRNSGIPVEEAGQSKTSSTGRKKPGIQGKGKGRGSQESRRQIQRDWGNPAERQETGQPNMSRGDPIIRLLRYLAAYWKKRFRITAPSLRKQGYKPLPTLEQEIKSFQNDRNNQEEHGERIGSLKDFRQCARQCEGSRDVGAHLFTALVRGLGIEARMVASLQPVGYGWTKAEEATIKAKKPASSAVKQEKKGADDEEEEGQDSSDTSLSSETKRPEKTLDRRQAKPPSKPRRSVGSQNARGIKTAPIDISDSSDLSALSGGSKDAENDDDSVIDVTPSVPVRKPSKPYDLDMIFPTYWTEVISQLTNEVYPVEPLLLRPPVATGQDQLAAFEPRGAKAEKAKLVMAYVIGFSSDGTAKEVTTRYLKRHMWPGRTKGSRLPVERVAVVDRRGKVLRHEEYDFFKRLIGCYARPHNKRTLVDDIEDAKDLKAIRPVKKEAKEGEETLQGYKQSAEFVLERFLRREEALKRGAKPVKTFVSGKRDKTIEEPVYRRKDVFVCKTSESWHKEGREIKEGQTPMKMVPIRAVTLIRKREVEEAERDTGEKPKQGVYSVDQTNYIIPPPIENGIIPKNAYGNIDCFVPSMVPEGAVHIPLRRTMNICKRLGIDFAEAVTGFEFGNKRAVPVVEGVIVAIEHEHAVIDIWEKDEEERRIKEEGKREKMALSMWRKLLMGMRIAERVRDEYGEDENGDIRDQINPFTNRNKTIKADKVAADRVGIFSDHADENMGGGFMVDDEDEKEHADPKHLDPLEVQEEDEGGGFLIEEEEEDAIVPTTKPIPEPQFIFNHQHSDSEESEDNSSNVNSDVVKNKKRTPTTKGADRKSRKPTGKTSPAKRPGRKPSKPVPASDMPASDVEPETESDFSGPDPVPTTQRSSRRTARAPSKRESAKQKSTPLKSEYFLPTDQVEDQISDDSSESSDEADAYNPKSAHGRSRKEIASASASASAIPQKVVSKRGRGRPRKTM